ncbi:MULTISPECIES: dihydroxyacetone kinase subunit DhaL [Microbacterium]|uniref:dihydroxyacetone kinase subunit DhaL n=1 Tax=Microbacterium TaxID=33882 RepID=UPI0023DAA0B9|nr:MULTISPECIES: dihydroxyacetone kinase subunit DhaL [Microbacterium]MDF2046298.1 dihydroxyacetone kinase subunit DhaL [Microbacterium sp. Kw_RZR3]MDQ1073832.1 dihydroxyacetone kinase-like protein [Microbacterium sp. SORGH_AS_0969]MDQ1114059.1 dihydroxyacetone kinase-like protein [Microbacterium testaceum]
MSGAVSIDDLVAWIHAFRDAVQQHKDELTRLDSEIGDADHGSNMARGLDAVVAKLDPAPATPAELFKTVGMTLVSSVGGASGPLYGTFFLRMGPALTSDDADATALGAALRAGVDGVVARGKAELGDKTMIDALAPALDAWDTAVADGADPAGAARAAAEAGARGRDSTEPLVARKGRASYLGERSAGHLDPGATSATLLLEALRDTLADAA